MLTYFVHQYRDVKISPYHDMSTIVRDVVRLEPLGRQMDMAIIVSDASKIPPIPDDVWYLTAYRKKLTGQILWKKAHAQVINAR